MWKGEKHAQVFQLFRRYGEGSGFTARGFQGWRRHQGR